MTRANTHSMPFGAELRADGRTRFRLWAPDAKRATLSIARERAEETLPMAALPGGWFELVCAASAGTRYRYLIDDRLPVPDPASRSQPEGPHGPSEVVDASRHDWRTEWAGRPWREAVVYELHVGAFTAQGTFEHATEKLGHLAALGVTALEIMPVSSFPGRRNWGYDGVLPFAPAAVYGGPEAMRAFVDAAHAHGLMVLLDVVYNHFGPEGNYLHAYASGFFTDRHETPWGDAVNFDGPGSRPVRDFFVHNALYWLTEFRLDGLRLDAVHAIADDSEPDIVSEIAATVHARVGRSRPVHLVLENERNEACYLRADERGRAAYAAQWNDDFHHAAHTLLTAEDDGYYVDYAERPLAHLRRCLTEGFAYQGESSGYAGTPRGEPSGDLASTAFIDFLQNHDQIGNRAFGERLAALAAPAPLRALTSLMLLAPAVPALFMGEEFGCRQPFLYFADFEGELADAVRSGRQREFARFVRFGEALPDPMDDATFRRCVLDWAAVAEPDHAAWLELHRTLLALRSEHIAPRLPGSPAESAGVFAATGLDLGWRLCDGSSLRLLANLAPQAIEPAPAQQARGRLLHAEPARAAAAARELPPWSVVWHLHEASP